MALVIFGYKSPHLDFLINSRMKMFESDIDCIPDCEGGRFEASSIQSLSSCLKKQDKSVEDVSQSPERHVSFDVIEILEFPLEIGDNPSVSRPFDSLLIHIPPC